MYRNCMSGRKPWHVALFKDITCDIYAISSMQIGGARSVYAICEKSSVELVWLVRLGNHDHKGRPGRAFNMMLMTFAIRPHKQLG